jgi:hypothetical protein
MVTKGGTQKLPKQFKIVETYWDDHSIIGKVLRSTFWLYHQFFDFSQKIKTSVIEVPMDLVQLPRQWISCCEQHNPILSVSYFGSQHYMYIFYINLCKNYFPELRKNVCRDWDCSPRETMKKWIGNLPVFVLLICTFAIQLHLICRRVHWPPEY